MGRNRKNKKADTLAVDEVDDVAWLELEELHEKTPALQQAPTFEDKIQALKKIFTQIEDVHKLWLTFTEKKASSAKDILIAITDTQEYFSNALPENEPSEECSTENKKYYIFCFYEDTLMDKKLFQLRVSSDGKEGEIVWIEKGKLLSGSDLMQVFSLLNNILNIQTTYLHDDAKANKMPIRVTRPLINPSEKTWYQEYGFEPEHCDNRPSNDSSYQYNQSPNRFKKAIDVVKKYKLSLILKSLKEKPKSFLSRERNHRTIGTLFKRLNNKARDVSLGSKQQQAKNNLLWFYTKCLSPKPLSTVDKGNHGYQQAVNDMHDTRLFALRKP